ncbi:MAG: pyridoxamine 5'-phosphate oxidase family protein [Olsenella sp.]|jgi:nitroimidazol reductase NimA-like FMN-containing flavoprotein (pyridoxamine 5'-phosphate oxidase superfamily)
MFRSIRRFKQQLSDEQCVEVLEGEHRGVLSLLGDDGYPYGVPLDHWYCEEDGHLYFHGAREGHKVDAMRACDKASYCVFEQGVPNERRRGLDVRCVIVFGRVRLVEDPVATERVCRALCEELFPGDKEYAGAEIAHAGRFVQCFELVPEHVTGKLVNES